MKMNIKNIKRRDKRTKKTMKISIRITPQLSKWLAEKNYSPTGVFYEALNCLGYKEEK